MAALRKNHSIERGFTLVELMVVVGIILIITGATIPSLTSYMRNQAVKQAQQQIVSDLRSTQVKALTGTLSNEEVNNALIRYWGISFNVGTGDYSIFIDSDTNNDCTGEIVRNEKLNGDIVLKTEGGNTLPSCVYFEMLDGDIYTPDDPSFDERSIVVGYDSDSGSDKLVTFNRMGLIFAED